MTLRVHVREHQGKCACGGGILRARRRLAAGWEAAWEEGVKGEGC